MILLARLNALLERALAALLSTLVVAMVLTVLWQVGTRMYARAAVGIDWVPHVQPSQWTEELAGFLLAWVALLGAAYALRRGEHIGLDSLVNSFDARWRARAARFAQACVLAFAALLVVGGAWLVWLTLELGQTTPALRWPMGAVYAVAPLSGLLMLCFAGERVFVDPEPSDRHPRAGGKRFTTARSAGHPATSAAIATNATSLDSRLRGNDDAKTRAVDEGGMSR